MEGFVFISSNEYAELIALKARVSVLEKQMREERYIGVSGAHIVTGKQIGRAHV